MSNIINVYFAVNDSSINYNGKPNLEADADKIYDLRRLINQLNELLVKSSNIIKTPNIFALTIVNDDKGEPKWIYLYYLNNKLEIKCKSLTNSFWTESLYYTGKGYENNPVISNRFVIERDAEKNTILVSQIVEFTKGDPAAIEYRFIMD